MATSEVVEPVGAPRALIYTRVSEDKRRGVADFPSVEVVMAMDKAGIPWLAFLAWLRNELDHTSRVNEHRFEGGVLADRVEVASALRKPR